METSTQVRPERLYKPQMWGMRRGFKFFMHLVSNYKVIGQANIPKPPFLLTFNHMSFCDAPAIAGAVDYVTPGFGAKKYKGKLKGLLFYLGSPVWIDQDAPDRRALMTALKIIEGGDLFAIAPEGRRSKGSLMQGQEGVAFIATRTNVPILPLAITGTEKIFNERRPEVRVTIGKAYHLPEGRAKGEQLREYTERVMCALAALLPESYRGVYAGHPLIPEMAAIVT